MGINSKDKRDVYYKLSKENGYRARSFYKLKHIDDTYNIFENVSNVVDLCGAPGSWSEYVAEKLKDKSNKKICIVDLQEIYPIEGVNIIKEDITTKECVYKILEVFGNEKSDLILCDGAPDITGIHDLDEYFQIKLVCSALKISLEIGKPGSNFISKIFRGKYCKYLVNHFKKFYKEVIVLKPKSSRSASIECFIYCKKLWNTEDCPLNISEESDIEDFEVFGCGNGPDSDLTINLLDKLSIYSKFKPINSPYEDSINQRK